MILHTIKLIELEQISVDGFFINPLSEELIKYLEIMCLTIVMSEVRLCPFTL